MQKYPNEIDSVEQLDDLLSEPTPEVIEYFQNLEGDIIILGVGGKIGPSLACMAKRASEMAGVKKRIIGVSQFSLNGNKQLLEKQGVETIQGNLMDRNFLDSLPKVQNVIYMAGKKFGSSQDQSLTWALNSYLPGLVAEHFRDSKIVMYSTGCVYPYAPIKSGGCTEQTQPDARGEYAQSCLGRERLFEYGSIKYKTPVVLIRLNYAVEMRYGVLVDVALKVKNGEPIDLTMGYANMIWQGDANAIVLQTFQICDSPAMPLNVTGPETLSIRWVANRFGELYNIDPVFENEESDTAWFSNAALCQRLFGYPKVSLDQVLLWTAKWVKKGLPLLNKPTHFETRDGKF